MVPPGELTRTTMALTLASSRTRSIWCLTKPLPSRITPSIGDDRRPCRGRVSSRNGIAPGCPSVVSKYSRRLKESPANSTRKTRQPVQPSQHRMRCRRLLPVWMLICGGGGLDGRRRRGCLPRRGGGLAHPEVPLLDNGRCGRGGTQDRQVGSFRLTPQVSLYFPAGKQQLGRPFPKKPGFFGGGCKLRYARPVRVLPTRRSFR